MNEMNEWILVGSVDYGSILIFFFSPQAEKQILFVIQTFKEITGIFEDADSTPWDKNTMENFLNIIHEQIDALELCVSKMCDCEINERLMRLRSSIYTCLFIVKMFYFYFNRSIS